MMTMMITVTRIDSNPKIDSIPPYEYHSVLVVYCVDVRIGHCLRMPRYGTSFRIHYLFLRRGRNSKILLRREWASVDCSARRVEGRDRGSHFYCRWRWWGRWRRMSVAIRSRWMGWRALSSLLVFVEGWDMWSTIVKRSGLFKRVHGSSGLSCLFWWLVHAAALLMIFWKVPY